MIRKILIIRLSSIGDIILTTPLLSELKKALPGSEISFVIKKRFADLVRFNPNIDFLLEYDEESGFTGLRRLRKVIKNTEFDLILDIHKNFRSIFLKAFHSAEKRTYKKDYVKRFLLVKFKYNRYKHPLQDIARSFFAAAEDIIGRPDKYFPEVFIPEETEQKIAEEYFSKLTGQFDLKIAMVPGAGFATKQWPLERFAGTGKNLARTRNGIIYILGGIKDIDKGKFISDHIGSNAVDLTGKLSLLETASVIKQCNFVITNDTGCMHMGWAFDKKMVALFGPTVRELGYFPQNNNSTVLETFPSCRPCTHNGSDICPKEHFSCMKDISVETVCKTCDIMLNG